MTKLPKIFLAYEPDVSSHIIYSGALEASNFIVKLAMNENDFFEFVESIIPDVILINATQEGVNFDAIYKKLKRNQLWSQIPVIYGVDKIGFNVETKIKKLKIDAIEIPFKNTILLQLAKKHSKTLIKPDILLDQDDDSVHVEFEISAEIFEIAEDKFTFISPAKLNKNGIVRINCPLIKELGLNSEVFESSEKGKMLDSKLFKNTVNLRGLSLKAIASFKKYYQARKAAS